MGTNQGTTRWSFSDLSAIQLAYVRDHSPNSEMERHLQSIGYDPDVPGNTAKCFSNVVHSLILQHRTFISGLSRRQCHGVDGGRKTMMCELSSNLLVAIAAVVSYSFAAHDVGLSRLRPIFNYRALSDGVAKQMHIAVV